MLRREVAGVTVPGRTLVRERPDGSIYLSSGGRGERSRIMLTSCRMSWKGGRWQIANGKAVGHKLSAIGHQPSAISYQPYAIPAILFPLFPHFLNSTPPHN